MATPKMLDLTKLREGIEGLDRDLLELLRRRMDLSDEVADAKIQAASPFRDRPREDQVLQRVRHLAADLELDPRQIERLYRVILPLSSSSRSEGAKKGVVRSAPREGDGREEEHLRLGLRCEDLLSQVGLEPRGDPLVLASYRKKKIRTAGSGHVRMGD